MAKNGLYIAVIVVGLLLFVAFFKRKKQGDYDDFFGDTEIVKDFEEAPIPTAVPNSILAATTDSGNSNSECEKSGYIALNIPNPTPNPLTLNMISPQDYYSQLDSYFQSSPTSSTPVTSSPIGIVVENNLWYIKNQSSTSILVFDPVNSADIATINISPNTGIIGTGLFSFNQKLYFVGSTQYISVIDINPLSTTYNQLITTIDCGGVALFTYSIVGTNLYVAYDSGLKKIDTVTNTLTSTIPIVAGASSNVYPNYKLNGVAPDNYLYYTRSFFASTTGYVFDTNTDTVTSTITFPDNDTNPGNGQDGIIAGNYLYIGRDSYVTIIDLLTQSISSSILTGSILYVSKSSDNSKVYASFISSVIVIDTISQSIQDTVVVGASISSLFFNNNLLYVSDASGNVSVINSLNTITQVINSGFSALVNPTLGLSGQFPAVLYCTISDSNIFSLTSASPNFIPPQTQVNLNNMANFVNNPGEICGIFYRSLTVAQMSNVFAINWTGITGETNNYKLIPITYKDAMSVLNQIYVSRFARPIIINNNLQFNHVINPGEDVYVKIYVRKFVSSTEMLKTGKIEASNTNGDNPEPEEEEWLDIEEVESQEWDAVHIQCPEPEEEEQEDEIEPEEPANFEEEFEDEFGEDGWLAGGLK